MINEESFTEKYSHFSVEIVAEIIDIFISEHDDRVEKIGGFIKSRNLEQLRQSTHGFKGVISNFETDCVAFEEISALENQSWEMLEKIKGGEALGTEEEEAFYKKMEIQFRSFKKNIAILLFDLKRLRINYSE